MSIVPNPPYPPPSLEMINLEVMTEAEALYQRKLIALREYFSGEQGSKPTERLKEFMPSLGKGFDFTLNIVSVIIGAVTEYLNIRAWDSENEKVAEWASQVWTANKMEARQDDVHEDTLINGEHFVLVSWNNEENRPEWTPIRAYTDPSVGGDGFGCRMVYPQNDFYQSPLYAIKRWSEVNERGKVTDFKTLYYPDRIEKYYRDSTIEWRERRDSSDDSWPINWTDNEGNPLGIPVVHFLNKKGTSEVEDVLALQDSVNKSALDTLITSDATAFRIYVALGWIPTTDGKAPNEDGSNIATIVPGMVYGTTNDKADFKVIEPPKESIEGMSELTQQLIIWAALMTNTPVTRVITTKLIASDETLKQQEKPHESKVALRRSLFSASWMQCIILSKKLSQLFQPEFEDFSEAVLPIWGSRLHTDKAELDTLETKQRLGVPQEQIWRELGYTLAKIKQMKAMIVGSKPIQGENDA